jgi:3-oxoacyl-[acyl-carrier protein] reductase
MKQNLRERRALVTGGSRGIGAAIVQRLAREGAHVALTYVSRPEQARETVRAAEALGVRALALAADSAEPEAVVSAVQRAATEFGGIDILVNNAGIAVLGALQDFSLKDFDRILAVNVRAVFAASQEAVRHMPDGGRIIHIGSCNAERVTTPGFTAYAMTKAALVGLTKGMARDLGSRGITVNNVQPGPVDTDMNPAQGPFADQARAQLALPRYAHVDEIASLVAFLAGPEAGFATGACWTIDGGYSA